MSASEIISWEQFDSITDNGAPDFMDIYQDFLTATPDLFAAIQRALDSGDEKQLVSTAHQLKGSAANFGFVGVSECAAQIESEGKNGQFANAPTLFAEAKVAYDQAVLAVAAKYPQ